MPRGLLSSRENDVDATSIAYTRMSPKWELIDDLLGGTQTMRERGERWLPKEPKEKDLQYRVRVNRSFLFGGLKDTIKKLVAKPFSRDINVSGDEDEKLAGIQDDVDRMGTNLTAFASEVFTAGIKYGLTHILVDFPSVPEGTSLAEERSQGIRPFFVHIPPTNLLGWKSELIDGKRRLIEIRIYEVRNESVDGSFDEIETHYVRVYTRNDWTLYKYNEKDKMFVETDSGTHTFGEVPLVTYYVDEMKGFLQAGPALEDLAWLNIAHWQSQSDQRNILRFARVGILFGRGFAEEDFESVSIGPNTLIKTTSDTADLKYVEHSGAALGAGRTDLLDLEAKMEILGLQPMIAARSGTQTATGKAIDEGRTESAIQAWIRRLESAISKCYELAARWVNVTLPDDFDVDIYNDFGITLRGETDNALLKDLATQNLIRHETLLRELKRRSVLSEGLDIEEEIEGTEEDRLEGIRRVAEIMVDEDAADDE